jgi:hypothetical protein
LELSNNAQKYEYTYEEASGIMYKYYLGEITLVAISASWDYVFITISKRIVKI